MAFYTHSGNFFGECVLGNFFGHNGFWKFFFKLNRLLLLRAFLIEKHTRVHIVGKCQLSFSSKIAQKLKCPAWLGTFICTYLARLESENSSWNSTLICTYQHDLNFDAQSCTATKWRFLAKNLRQLVIFVIELAFT